MNACGWTPTSCAQIRGWTLSWWTSWCCSWTGSTHRYSVTKKLTGSLLLASQTVLISKPPDHWAEGDSISHVCFCSSGTWMFPQKCVWRNCWNTSVGRARRRVKNSTEDSTFKPRMSTPACQQGSYKEVKKRRQKTDPSAPSQSLKWLKSAGSGSTYFGNIASK